MDFRKVRFEGTQWTRLALDGVHFLETLNTSKNFDYEEGKGYFDKMNNYQFSRMTLYNHRLC
jgi:hypothetical protein